MKDFDDLDDDARDFIEIVEDVRAGRTVDEDSWLAWGHVAKWKATNEAHRSPKAIAEEVALMSEEEAEAFLKSDMPTPRN